MAGRVPGDRSVVPGDLGPSGNPWRAVAAAFYEACGSPDVPGYSGLDIAAALGGHGPVNVDTLKAMIEAVREHVQSLGSTTIGGGDRIENNFAHSHISVTLHGNAGAVDGPARSWLDVRQDEEGNPGVYLADPGSPLQSIAGMLGVRSARSGTSIVLAGSEPQPVQPTRTTLALAGPEPQSAPLEAEDAGMESAPQPRGVPRSRTRRSMGRVGPPPSPEGVRTQLEFMKALRALWDWSGMTTRVFEEKSKEIAGPKKYIAKSTVHDAMKRDTVPEEEVLAVILAVLLPDAPGEQARWQTSRLKVENGQGNAQLVASADTEHLVGGDVVAEVNETGSEIGPAQSAASRRRIRWPRRG